MFINYVPRTKTHYNAGIILR